MRILILGAGALGGYFGAHLLAAGRDVTFLVRPARAELLVAHGLNLISPHDGDLRLGPPPTVLTPDGVYDLILLSAKAYDLESAMEAIAPAVGPATAILPMLNGIAHLAKLDARFGAEHVMGGSCFLSASLDPDGTIRHLGDLNRFAFGERTTPQPRMAEIAAALTGAGFEGVHHPNILQTMWEKWTFLTTFAAATCLLRANIGETVRAGASPLVLAMFEECIRVAAAEGHPPSEASLAAGRAYLTAPGSTMEASMLRDLEAGARIELEQIVGDLLQRAQKHGVPTPLLAVAYAHLRCYEVRRERA